MTGKVLKFPKKVKTEKVHIIRGIDDLEETLKKLYQSGVKYGRSQGFLIGSTICGTFYVALSFLMRHA